MVLDFAGFVPVLGAGPDAINTIISAGRGNWGDAAVNAIAIIPFWGDGAKAGKMLAKAGQEGVQHVDEVAGVVNAVAKNGDKADEIAALSDDAIEGGFRAADDFTNLTHWTPPPEGSLLDRAWKDEFAELSDRFNGKVVDNGGPALPHPQTGKPVHGTYNPVTNTITLFDGADDVTKFHELLHWLDVQKALEKGTITREWIGKMDAATWKKLYRAGEERVWTLMRNFGFEPAK